MVLPGTVGVLVADPGCGTVPVDPEVVDPGCGTVPVDPEVAAAVVVVTLCGIEVGVLAELLVFVVGAE